MFFMQYLENLCVPTIVYCNSTNASLCVTWEFYFIFYINFERLISAIEKVALSVRFILENHSS